MTFSIAARCARTGMFGVAVSSSSPAVAARCAFVRAGVGAVTSQNITDPRLGPAGLDLLAKGADASGAIDKLRVHAGETAEYRQMSVVDAQGRSAVFSGERALGTYAGHHAANVAAAGNMLTSRDLPRLMVERFQSEPDDHLADRLLDALDTALAHGGEEGPVHSAGLLVVADQEWPLVDLRVDWSETPLADLRDLWKLWRPQMTDYVTRALDPSGARAYGVPGDP